MEHGLAILVQEPIFLQEWFCLPRTGGSPVLSVTIEPVTGDRLGILSRLFQLQGLCRLSKTGNMCRR